MAALLNLLDVSLHFGGPAILEKINFQIESGERVCLLGRNGAGKSTLMKLIAGEIKSDTGQIFRQPGAHFARLRIRQGLKQDRVDDREHGRVGPDAERQEPDDVAAEVGVGAQLAKSSLEQVHGGWGG